MLIVTVNFVVNHIILCTPTESVTKYEKNRPLNFAIKFHFPIIGKMWGK